VIERQRLGAAENLWLRSLGPGLKAEEVGEILDQGEKRGREGLGAYIHAVLEANPQAVEEVIGMRKKKLTLDEVLEKSGLTAKWEQRGVAMGEAIGKKTGRTEVIALLKQGYTVEQIERMDPGNFPSPVKA
jgi:hypothetical protein